MWLKKNVNPRDPPRKPPGNGRSNSMGWKKTSSCWGGKKGVAIFLKVFFASLAIRFEHFFRDFLQDFLHVSYLDSQPKHQTSPPFFFRTQVRVGGGRFSQKNRALVTEIPKRSENSLRMNFFEPPKIGWFVVLCVFLSKGKEWGLDEGAAVGALGLVANRLDPTRCPLKSSRNTSSHTWGEWCFGYIFGSKYGCFQK